PLPAPLLVPPGGTDRVHRSLTRGYAPPVTHPDGVGDEPDIALTSSRSLHLMAARAEATHVALDASRSPDGASGRLLAAPDDGRRLAPGLLTRSVAGADVPLWVLLVALLSAAATLVVGARSGGPGLPVLG